MTAISKPAFYAVFKNGEIMFECKPGSDQWGLAERVSKENPDGRHVELILRDVLRDLEVREVEEIALSGLQAGVFQGTPLYVCVIGSRAERRDSERVNFWGKSDLSAIENSLTAEAKAALSIPSVWDRFL